MNNRSRTITAYFALTAALLLSPLAAAAAKKKTAEQPTVAVASAIELGAPFADNAILQREMELPVWGWSKPGTTITVEFVPRPGSGQAGQKETAKAGADGKWLQPQPLEVTLVKGPNVLSFESQEGSRGVTIKDITLTPIRQAQGGPVK